MKYIFVMLLFSFGLIQTPQDIIYWSENNKFEWKDFKAAPNLQSTGFASTNSGLSHRVQLLGDTLIMTVRSRFDPAKSWVKKGAGIPVLLAHERLHFDITELYCRELKKNFREGHFKKQTLKIDIDNLIRESGQKAFQTQTLYDSETNHSINPEKQKEWETKIALDLKSLSAYRDPAVKVILTN